MEEFRLFVINNWSAILEYTLLFVSYFLVALYRGKINTTKRDLSLIFKENTNEMIRSSTALSENIDEARKVMAKELEESKKAYSDAIDTIKILTNDLGKVKSAVEAFFEDIPEEVNEDAKLHTNKKD